MIEKIFCGVIVIICATPASGQECAMARAFVQPDGNAPTRETAVWADTPGSALFFVESLNVNTDGTRRSYSVEDFWGQKTALNNLCNAMTDACAGLDEEALRTRRIVTQKAHAAGWPADLLKETRISSSIIPFKDGKPCPLVDGFLVSATALRRPGGSDVCNIANYVDALTVPALVLPRAPRGGRSEFATRGAGLGDLVVAIRPGGTDPVYAIVGDTGPAGQLGEGSVALNGKLLGKTAPPVNYDEVRGRRAFAGRSWVVPRAAVLIFPDSGDLQRPLMTVAEVEAAAKKRFETWGGVARLAACMDAYTRP